MTLWTYWIVDLAWWLFRPTRFDLTRIRHLNTGIGLLVVQ